MSRAASPDLIRLWQQRINSHARSGLSVVRFCQAHGLEPYNFYFWRRKLATLSPAKPNHLNHSPAGDRASRRGQASGNQARRGRGPSQLSRRESDLDGSSGLASAGLVPLRIVDSSPSSSVCIRFASGVVVEASAEMACRAIEQILVTEQALRRGELC
jgi:hypothetical protein